jgi:hypothetical protein
MVATLLEGDSKYSNQSAQHKTSCKCGWIDRLLANDPRRGKFYFNGLNTIDRRIGEVYTLEVDVVELHWSGMKEF